MVDTKQMAEGIGLKRTPTCPKCGSTKSGAVRVPFREDRAWLTKRCRDCRETYRVRVYYECERREPKGVVL